MNWQPRLNYIWPLPYLLSLALTWPEIGYSSQRPGVDTENNKHEAVMHAVCTVRDIRTVALSVCLLQQYMYGTTAELLMNSN